MKNGDTVTLYWKKGFFKCAYALLLGGKAIGRLKESKFSQSATGEIDGRVVRFKMTGWLRQKTDIVDVENNRLIGRVSYNCWRPKAKVVIGGEVYDWGFNNLWETRWSLSDQAGKRIDYCGSVYKGKADLMRKDGILALTGLFIGNYYWQLASIYVAILFPLMCFPLL